MKISSSMMRRVALVHKSGAPCPIGVAFGPDGQRILGQNEAPRPNEAVDYFTKCPVCGKKYHEKEQAETTAD